MVSREKMTPSEVDALNAAQVEFTANPLFLAPQTKYFLQVPGRIFDEVEKFWTTWYQRRQSATGSMIQASKRLVSEGGADPASAMKEIADWQTHSMERLAEDAEDCAEMVTQCAGALFNNQIAASGKTVETTKKMPRNPANKSRSDSKSQQ